jgi:flagellar assembly protein FliH
VLREQDVSWHRWEMNKLTPQQRGAAARADPASDRKPGSQQPGSKPQPQGPATKKADGGPAEQTGSKRDQANASARGVGPDETRRLQQQAGAAGTTAPPSQSSQPGNRRREQKATPAADSAARRREAAHQKTLENERKQAREEGHREGVEAGHAEGYEQGLQAGREAAHEELQAQIAETLTPIRNLATQFSEALAQLDDEMANHLVELALTTGRQLAADALDARPEQVVDLVRGLLHSEPAMHGRPRLWLNPEDLKLVSEWLGEELEAAGWALQPDDQVSRGGCRVTSENGELDATWESRWEAIQQQVRQRRSTSERAAEARELKAAAEAAPGPPVQPPRAEATDTAENRGAGE